MQTEINNQVAIIENSIEVLKTGPEILQANQIRKDKALSVGSNILDAIEQEGMNPELDERCMNYMANVITAHKTMKENRSGVSQIMDQLKKMYTEVENELDPKKPGTIPAKIQTYRDNYAKEVAAEKERKRKEAEMIAAKAKEAIDLRAECEKRLFNKYNDYLRERKIKLQTAFNDITLETIEETSTTLRGYQPTLKVEALSSFQLGLYASYHTAADIKAFTDEIINLKYSEYAANYIAELSLFRDELIEFLSSKKAELVEQKRLDDEKKELEEKAKKDHEAKKRLEENEAKQKKMDDEKRQREAEDQKKIDAQAAESKAAEESKIDVKKQGEETMVMFEKEAATAELDNGPEARQGYEIIVLHPVGFTQIFAIWFENEGKNLPIDKIGNTKLDQMKAWAEKHAQKTGTKIESKFIKYEDSFKAVNRKAK